MALSWGQNCSIPPLSFTIQNTTFSDGIAVNRGIQTLLGAQLLGLRLSLSQNNTRVRNSRDCSDIPANFSSCQGASGGVYTIPNELFVEVPPSRWNVSVIDPHPPDTTITFGYGPAEFPGTQAAIAKLPCEVWSDTDAANKSQLPLGPSSSFLSRLVEDSLAPTRNFGLYYGSRSQDEAKNGQLIIGGIDTARFDASTLEEFPLAGYGASSRCPLQVMLADVILTNSEGNHTLFKDPDARVPACIDTIQNAFTFTKAMYQEWGKLTRHIDYDGSNYSVQTYPKDREVFIGSLTIKLSNGYESIIPHFELLSMERGTDSQGKYSIINSSRVMAAVQTGQGDLGVDVPLLGGVFLSQNYLRVDYDQERFWLAKAVTDNLVPMSVNTICEPKSSETGSSAGMPATASSDIGLKVGLPVTFVIVASGLFGWWLFKSRRSNALFTAPNGKSNLFHRAFSFSAKAQHRSYDDVGEVRAAPDAFRKGSELETIEKPVQLSSHDVTEADRSSRRISELDGTRVAELETPTASPNLKSFAK